MSTEPVNSDELEALLIEEIEKLRSKRRRPFTPTPTKGKPKEDKSMEKALEALKNAGINLSEEDKD